MGITLENFDFSLQKSKYPQFKSIKIQTTIEIDALRNNSRCLFFHLSNGIMNDIRSYKKIAIRHDDDGDEHTF